MRLSAFPIARLSCSVLPHHGEHVGTFVRDPRRVPLIPSEVYDPVATLEMIQEERATAFIAVSTMYIGALNHPRFNEFDVSSLRTGIMAPRPAPSRSCAASRPSFTCRR